MANIASMLKDEITRLARRELRTETEGLKKVSAQYRSDIAALKRRVATLEKQLTVLERRAGKSAKPETAETTSPARFSAKGLLAQRKRLGLSAADMGILLGVSSQTVYNWETGSTRPRQQQMAAIGTIRGMGKREAQARLEAETK